MTEVILTALAIAIIVYGIWFCYQEGEIFSFVSKYGNKYVPKLIRPSLFQCPVCMVPYYGVLIYFAVYGHVNWWTVFVLAIALGINAIIVGFHPKKEVQEETIVTTDMANIAAVHAKELFRYYIEHSDGEWGINFNHLKELGKDEVDTLVELLYHEYLQSLKQ